MAFFEIITPLPTKKFSLIFLILFFRIYVVSYTKIIQIPSKIIQITEKYVNSIKKENSHNNNSKNLVYNNY